VVIFGWWRRFTVLGAKLDGCQTCGHVGRHVVGRTTYWGHVFWVPVLFLGFRHGMVCAACGAWSSLPWRRVRAAMKVGTLPLDRPRPNAPAALAAAAAEEDRPPSHPAGVFDPLVVNPKRGAWDLYLKVWPALAALVLVVGVLSPGASAAGGSGTTLDPGLGPAHQCWQAPDGSINGCRLANGSVEGSGSGTPITCYFDEPLPASATTITCDPR
jgi:hypothetical protein